MIGGAHWLVILRDVQARLLKTQILTFLITLFQLGLTVYGVFVAHSHAWLIQPIVCQARAGHVPSSSMKSVEVVGLLPIGQLTQATAILRKVLPILDIDQLAFPVRRLLLSVHHVF